MSSLINYLPGTIISAAEISNSGVVSFILFIDSTDFRFIESSLTDFRVDFPGYAGGGGATLKHKVICFYVYSETYCEGLTCLPIVDISDEIHY